MHFSPYQKTSLLESIWIGITTPRIFSSSWGGSQSPPIDNEPAEQLEGRIAYEVNVKKPVKSGFTKDRTEVTPTGRLVGTIIDSTGSLCNLKIEKWFTETEDFVTRGTWRTIAGGMPELGETIYMKVVQ